MQAENFVINEREHVTDIRSRRSQKEWLAIIVSLMTGAGVAFFTVMMYFQTYYHQWIFWVFAFLFLLLAVVKLTEGFSKLLQPTAHRIVIDQQQCTLSAWLSNDENLVLSFDDIRAVLLNEIANDPTGSEQVPSPVAYVIALENKDGLTQVIARIQPAQSAPFNVASNPGKVAHTLAKVIADKTGSLFEDHTATVIDLTAIMH